LADPGLDLLSEVTDAKDDVVAVVGGKKTELVQEKRLPGDLEERLRRVCNPIPEAGSKPAGEDADCG
jgi:hypothetical protein